MEWLFSETLLVVKQSQHHKSWLGRLLHARAEGKTQDLVLRWFLCLHRCTNLSSWAGWCHCTGHGREGSYWLYWAHPRGWRGAVSCVLLYSMTFLFSSSGEVLHRALACLGRGRTSSARRFPIHFHVIFKAQLKSYRLCSSAGE